MYTPIARRAVLSFRMRARALTVTLVAITITQLSFLVGGQPDSIAHSLTTAYSLLCFALPIIFVAGVVSGDLRSGTVRLWLQKPVDPVVYYMNRFLEALTVTIVLTVLALGLTRLGIAAVGAEPVAIGELLDMLPLTLIVGAIGFGCSAWMPRGSGLGTIAVAAAGLIAGESLPGLLGRPWNWVADTLLLPASALEDFRNFVLGESDAIWTPIARIMAYSIGWTALGALGIWHTVNKGRLPSAEQS